MTFFGTGKDTTPPRYKTPTKDKAPQQKKPATQVKTPPRKTAVDAGRTPPPMRMGAAAMPKRTPQGKMQVPKSPLQKTSKSDSRFSEVNYRASVMPGRPSVAVPTLYNRPSVVPGRPSVAVPTLYNRPSVAVPGFYNRPSVAPPSVHSLAQQSQPSGGRASVMHPAPAGGGRPASFFIEPFTVKPEDRKLEKPQLTAMAKKVCQFLETLPDLSFVITEKKLRENPVTNDFTNVFTAIYRCIAPGYSLGKPEIDTPPIFAALGYPYRLEKKCFVPLGAPHSWKFLLAALAWLVDVVQAAKPQGGTYGNIKRTPEMTYSTNCYRELKEAPTESLDVPTFNELLDNYRQMAMSDEGLSNEEYEGVKRRREQQALKLRHYEEGMEKEDDELAVLQKEISDFEQDINAISDYVEKNRVQTAALDEITGENAARIHRMSEELAGINATNHLKEERIVQQPVSGEQVRQLNAERQNLRAQIHTTRAAVERYEQLCFENQPKAFEISSELRVMFKTFVSRLRELCNQLLDEQAASGLDWNACEIDSEALTSDEFIAQTHDSLFNLIAGIKSAVEEGIDSMRRLQDEISQRAEEGARQLLLVEANMGKIATEHNLKVEQLLRDVRVANEQARDADHELEITKANHKRIKDDMEELQRRVAEVSTKVANEEKRFVEEKAELGRLFKLVEEAWKRKMEQLRITFHQLCRHKQELKDLGERLLAQNNKTIEELRKNESDRRSPQRRKDPRK